MDSPSLSLVSSPLAPSGAAGSLLAAAGGEGVRGADFANLLSQLMQPAELRQDLAAGAPPALQAMSLSPNIEVITADAPLPDNDSLLAFARSQGLDNATLQALFLPGQALPVTAPGAAAMPAAADPVAEAGTTLAGLAALGGQALKRLDVQLASPPAASAAAAAAEAAAEPVAPPPALLQEVMRLRLQPQEAITRRLADLAATGQQATWGQLSTAAASTWQGDVLALDLGGLEPEALEALAPEAELPAPTHAGAHSGEAGRRLPGTAEPAAMPAAQTEERAAQYERLAQRLGEALGQRLQAQIERGQWKVQMQVDPASLGRIDMELDMRAGGLDAVFRSDNQITRDLIAQGLPRLRESLAQSGTAVANVWVQGDSSRQSGGNPTPGRWASSGRTAAGAIEEEGTVQAATRTARPNPTSAWDVLA